MGIMLKIFDLRDIPKRVEQIIKDTYAEHKQLSDWASHGYIQAGKYRENWRSARTMSQDGLASVFMGNQNETPPFPDLPNRILYHRYHEFSHTDDVFY